MQREDKNSPLLPPARVEAAPTPNGVHHAPGSSGGPRDGASGAQPLHVVRSRGPGRGSGRGPGGSAPRRGQAALARGRPRLGRGGGAAAGANGRGDGVVVWVGVGGDVLFTAAVVHSGLRDLIEMRGTKPNIPSSPLPQFNPPHALS